ncbi:FecR family protein [Simiduia curdlanivorans]|uniref:FecR family protein n=1 Tax=Simiduia curdlanivorans TaxID=1492769 RepID=A0ABV8V8T8_9GAMM|nr:FecR family protein [Simiduia curdlanivorans]MDN3638894.1 FecR family protein [Simiduia curdlanivorans]
MNAAEQNQLSLEASGWIARLRSDAATHADKAAFSSWLNRDANHELAFDNALSDWQTASALKYSRQAQALLLPSQQSSHSFSTWFFNWQSAALASIVLAAFVGLGLLKTAPSADVDTLYYATEVGEQKSINLPDGSTINLNTNSQIHVQYSDSERRLILDGGEAFFKVASNRARPFVVDVGEGTVTAVGTAFGVNRDASNIKVTVIEGIVSVKERETQPQIKPESLLVKADEGLSIDLQGLSSVQATNAHQALAWRNKLLVLENQPLTAALSELNRYLKQPVDSSDPSLAKLRVSGTFSLQTPESTLTALITTFDLQQDTSGDSARLYARSE